MRKICFAVLSILLTTILLIFPASALTLDADTVFTDTAKTILEDGKITSFNHNSDWYAFAFSRYGIEFDKKDYAKQLLTALSSDISRTDRLRMNIVLLAIGEEAVIDVAEVCASPTTLNEAVYGLLLLSMSKTDDNDTENKLIDYILSKELPQGGYALFGNNTDTDTTASVLCALSMYSDDPRAKAAADRCAEKLISMRLAGGGFSSMGVENCESLCQVIIAFCSYDVGSDDSSLIGDLVEQLTDYSVSGGFSHLKGGQKNNIATYQALSALAAVKLYKNGERLYEAAKAENGADTFESHTSKETASPESKQETEPSKESTASGSNTQTTETESQNSDNKPFPIKAVLITVLISISAVGIYFALKKKKGRLSHILLICGCFVLALCMILLTDFSMPQDGTSTETVPDNGISVTLTINCSAAIGQTENDYIPKDGMILDETVTVLIEGSSALDAIYKLTMEKNIQIDVSGAYIKGIEYLYEKDCGPLSGWTYYVNGEEPSVGADSYILEDGDALELRYVLSFAE